MALLVLPGSVMNAPKPERWQPTPGDYILQVDEAKEEPYTNSKTGEQGTRLAIVNKIVMGPGQAVADQGKTVYGTYFLQGGDAKTMQSNLGQLRIFVEALGLADVINQNGGNIDPDWMVGRQYACHVAIKKDFTRITDERPVGAPSTRGGNRGQQAQAQQAPVAQPGFIQPVGQPQVQQYAPPPQVPPMQQYAPPAQQFAQPQYAQPMPSQQFAQPQPMQGQLPQMPQMPQQAPQPGPYAAPPPPAGYMPPRQ